MKYLCSAYAACLVLHTKLARYEQNSSSVLRPYRFVGFFYFFLNIYFVLFYFLVSIRCFNKQLVIMCTEHLETTV